MIIYKIYIDKNKIYDSEIDYNEGILSANLSLEINQPENLSLRISSNSPILQNIRRKSTLVYVYQAYMNSSGEILDWYYPFMGRVSDISVDIYGNYDVTCEGAFAFLNDVYTPYCERYNRYPDLESIVKAAEASSRVIYKEQEYPYYKMYIGVDIHASEGLDTKNEEAYQHEVLEDYDSVSTKSGDLISDKVLNSYGGVLYFRYYIPEEPSKAATLEETIEQHHNEDLIRYYEEKFPKYNIQFIYTKNINPGYNYKHTALEFPEVEAIVQEEYGRYPSFGIGDNILSISKESIKSEVYSGIMPVGKDGCRLESMVYPDSPLKYGDVIWIPELVSKYGYIVKAVEFSDIETVTALREAGDDYINRFAKDFGFKYTVNAIEPCEVFDDMDKLVKLAHVTMVKDIDNVVHIMPCLSIKLDLFDIQNNEYVIGPIVPDSVINEDISNMQGG